MIAMVSLTSTSPVLGAETVLIADLSGDQEVPGPGDPDGAGFSEVRIDPEAGTVCFFIGVDPPSLTLPAVAAHIHEGAAGEAGDIVVTLQPPDASGSVEACADADAGVLEAIIGDPTGYYVNVHTSDFPDGAVRGQLRMPLPQLFAGLSGAAEVPGPGDPDGSGFAVLHDIDVAAGSVCYFIEAVNIETATAAHVHQAPEGVAGDIVIPLTPPDASGLVDDCTTADPALLQAILDDPAGFYVNVHTPTYPGGAIRGQLATEPPPPVDCSPPTICDIGTMPPGPYTYGGFPAPLTFTTHEPWLGRLFPDGFGLEAPDVPAALYVMTFDGSVFDLPCGEMPATTGPSVDAFADWIGEHPSLDASSPEPVTVGGATGVAIDVTATLPAGCSDGTLTVFGNPLDPFFLVDGERVRFVAVDVLGTTVVFIIDVFDPAVPFDPFLARAQSVLDSMAFALAPVATPTPTATPVPTGSVGASTATPRASSLPNTAIGNDAAPADLRLVLILAAISVGSSAIVLARRRHQAQ
jgi:hypothetical protein